MLSSLFGWLSADMAIDLGTANTLVYVKGINIVLNEPSVVAIAKVRDKRQVLAVGGEAKRMLGRSPGNIEAIRPLRDGVIADFEIAEDMIKYFIRKVHNRRSFASPLVVIAVPSGSTAVERRAIQESAEAAGARKVFLIEEPMAAAIGIGIDVSKPIGSMIVDIGGGTTEIAVISLNGISAIETIKVAGDEQTDAIIDWFKNQHKLGIGERTAENIKCSVGSAVRVQGENINVKGQDLITGIPKTIEIPADEIRQALAETVFQITTAIKKALDKTPPEHAADIIDRGIILTGGGALLKDLDVHIRNKTNLPCFLAEEPLLSVIKGTGIVLDDIKKYKEVLITT